MQLSQNNQSHMFFKAPFSPKFDSKLALAEALCRTCSAAQRAECRMIVSAALEWLELADLENETLDMLDADNRFLAEFAALICPVWHEVPPMDLKVRRSFQNLKPQTKSTFLRCLEDLKNEGCQVNWTV